MALLQPLLDMTCGRDVSLFLDPDVVPLLADNPRTEYMVGDGMGSLNVTIQQCPGVSDTLLFPVRFEVYAMGKKLYSPQLRPFDSEEIPAWRAAFFADYARLSGNPDGQLGWIQRAKLAYHLSQAFDLAQNRELVGYYLQRILAREYSTVVKKLRIERTNILPGILRPILF